MAKNHLVGNYGKYEFKEMVKDATARFAAIYAEKPVDDGIKSKKSALKTLLDSLGVRNAEHIVGEIISNSPCSKKKGDKFLKFVPFACVVPLRNRNHHAYRLGEPVIMIHGDDGANSNMFGMDKRGCIISKSDTAKDGLSHLPRLRESLRPATSSEITSIVNALFD
jgi:hypothetical protein